MSPGRWSQAACHSAWGDCPVQRPQFRRSQDLRAAFFADAAEPTLRKASGRSPRLLDRRLVHAVPALVRALLSRDRQSWASRHVANYAASAIASSSAFFPPIISARAQGADAPDSGSNASTDPMFAALLAQMMAPPAQPPQTAFPFKGSASPFLGSVGQPQFAPARMMAPQASAASSPLSQPVAGAQQSTPAWLRQLTAAGVQMPVSTPPIFVPNVTRGAYTVTTGIAQSPAASLQQRQFVAPPAANDTTLPPSSGTQQSLQVVLQQIMAANPRTNTPVSGVVLPNGVATLPTGVPSYGQAAPVNNSAVPTTSHSLPQPWLQQIIAATTQTSAPAFTIPSPGVAAGLPAGVLSHAQSLPTNPAVSQPASQSAVRSSLQQFIAANWQTNSPAAAPNVMSGLPASVPSYAQSVPANAANAQPVSQLPVQASLQQLVPAALQANRLVASPNVAAALPMGVLSYAQSPAASAAVSQPVSQSTVQPSLHQFLTANWQPNAVAAAPNLAVLPASVPGYAQSVPANVASAQPASQSAVQPSLQQFIAATLQRAPGPSPIVATGLPASVPSYAQSVPTNAENAQPVSQLPPPSLQQFIAAALQANASVTSPIVMAGLPAGLLSYAQSPVANAPISQPVSQSTVQPSLHQFIAANWQTDPVAPSLATGLPAGVPSYARSLSPGTAVPQPASQLPIQSSLQQFNATALQTNEPTASPNATPGLPASAPGYERSVPANVVSVQPPSQLSVQPSLQQFIAAALQRAPAASPNVATGLPEDVPSYAHSVPASTASAQPVPQTPVQLSPQQFIAAALQRAPAASPNAATGLPADVPSYAHSVPASTASAQPVPQTPVQLSPQQFIAAALQRAPAASPNVATGLPADVPSYAQSVPASTASAQPVPQTPVQLSPQQFIAAALQRAPAASPNAATGLPADVPSYAQSVPVNTANPQPVPQTPVQPSLKQFIAAALQRAPATSPNVPTGLPADVPSYAQSVPVNTSSVQPVPQTPVQPSLQQFIAALQRVPAVSPSVATELPADVPSYAQSVASSQPASPSWPAQPSQYNASPAQTVPASPAPLPQGVHSQETAATTSFEQKWMAASQGGLSAIPPTTNRVVNTAPQPAVAAANIPRAIPASPPALQSAASETAFTTPAVQPGSNSHSLSSTGPLATLLQNLRTGIVVPNFKPPAAPSSLAQTSQPAQSTQSSQTQAAGMDSGPSAQAQSAPVTQAEIVMAQAAQGAIRQGASAPVTEAQSLPLHLNLSSVKPVPGANNANQQSTTGPLFPNQAGDAAQGAGNSSQVSAPSATPHTVAAPQLSTPASTAAASTAAPPATSVNASALQTAATQMSAPVAPAPSHDMAASQLPQAGAPNFAALAMSIAAKSMGGAQHFDIRLDPPDLGRVQVRLSLDAAGTAQAHLAADKPETLALLQSGSSTLTRALHDSGVQLASNGLQFSLRGQDRQGEGAQRGPTRHQAAGVDAIGSTDAAANAVSTYGLSRSGAGINILV